MASQLDLDQGGTFRQTQRVYLGPSLGWVSAPSQNIVNVTVTGTTTIQRGMNLVLVSIAATATIQLSSAKQSPAGAQALPGTFVIVPVVIVDAGGFANATTHKITILPFGAETIDGLASIAITALYGAYVLKPNITTGGWTLIQ